MKAAIQLVEKQGASVAGQSNAAVKFNNNNPNPTLIRGLERRPGNNSPLQRQCLELNSEFCLIRSF